MHEAVAETDSRRLRNGRLLDKLRRELGPSILAALGDETVVEVMINEDGGVWSEDLDKGMHRLSEDVSPQRAMSLVGTVAALLDTVANDRQPIVEGELPFFGYRFEGIIPPVAKRATVAIRKHARRMIALADYVEGGHMAAHHADILREAIVAKWNIVVAGGTSSGKTTLVNSLLHEKVDLGEPQQRFVILEDTVEISCDAENRVQLRTSDTADLARLIRATMRLRPDTIIVGEVRGREALDMLKAWNTGHPGGITTVHANSARAALSRLDQLLQEAGVPSQPQLVGEAVDLVVDIRHRVVHELLRVRSYDPGSQLFQVEPL